MKWILLTVLCLLAVACKSGETQKADPLPFHVAILPVDVEKADLVVIDEEKKAEVVLHIDSQRFSTAMVEALDGQAFTQATLLSAPPDGATELQRSAHWIAEAQAVHADLILDADLEFDEDVGTEINDKFWMNLPLFLLGGPATWFVNDRSYQFHVSIEAHVYDVTAASRYANTLDQDSRITRVDHEVKEASLDFLDRADGTGSYALSILVPSGFLSKESDNVPEELEVSITEQLGLQVAEAIQSRSREVSEAENLVDFHPENVLFVEENGEFWLKGQLVLSTDQVANLNSLFYRVNGGELVQASWGEVQTDPEKRQRIYEFKVPAGQEQGGSVQLVVEQQDREATARSLTYSPRSKESK